MGDYQSNVYYHPEKHGLTVVAEIEYSDACYQFDTRVVWKDAEGNFYTARDSGCSCPTPFEEYTTIESLEKADYDTLLAEVREETVPDSLWSRGQVTANIAHDFIKTLREEMPRA